MSEVEETKENWWGRHYITTRLLSIMVAWALYMAITGYLDKPKEVDLDIVYYTLLASVFLITVIHFGINKGIEMIKAWKGK